MKGQHLKQLAAVLSEQDEGDKHMERNFSLPATFLDQRVETDIFNTGEKGRVLAY